MIDLRQTSEYAKFMKGIGWISERKNGLNYFIKKLPIIGNFMKIQRPEKLGVKEIGLIKRLSNKYRPFRIIIEPKNKNHVLIIMSYGFKLSKTPFVPPKTILIDLTKSLSQLLKEMHYKTRYNIKKTVSEAWPFGLRNKRSLALRAKLEVISSRNINAFADFWQDCARKQRGMFLSQKKEIVQLYKAFGKNAHLILVIKNKEILSGILMICTKDIAYYMYAASTSEGKDLFAPTINVWAAIKLAKKLKCKIFDFEGIYDVRFPLKSWLGFTRFKKSFGGKEVEYPGAYQKFLLPLKL